MTPDQINATFEFGGAVFLCANVVQLHHDKEVKGVHWAPVVLFMCWGVWNLFYYPHLDQPYSFMAGILVVLVNAVWFSQMLWYGRSKSVLTPHNLRPAPRDPYRATRPTSYIQELKGPAVDMTDVRNIPRNSSPPNAHSIY